MDEYICFYCGETADEPGLCPYCGEELEEAIECSSCGNPTLRRKARHRLCPECEKRNRSEFQQFLNSRTDDELEQLNDEWEGEWFYRTSE